MTRLTFDIYHIVEEHFSTSFALVRSRGGSLVNEYSFVLCVGQDFITYS
jgi:hypothetical protein